MNDCTVERIIFSADEIGRRVGELAARLAADYPPGELATVAVLKGSFVFVADLARQLDLPLIIVARLGLGTLNHTLLTVRQAQAMKLKVAGVLLNDTTGQRGLAERTNIKVIAELSGVPLLGVVPYGRARGVRQICDRLW